MNLYGIETESDCRREIDELLGKCSAAEKSMNKDLVADLKSDLTRYYKMGNTNAGQERMSEIERCYFWPAIREAYVKAPNLNSRRTWPDGLNEIRYNLSYYRPKER